MRRIILLALLLIGCTPLSPQPQPLTKELLVYDGEYVVEAKGDWCPWAPGQKECVTVYGRGTYVISETKHVKLIRPEVRALGGSPVVPYDPAKDLCKTEFKNEECSPNWVLSIDSPAPNDPFYERMWGLTNIEMARAWEVKNSSMARVAVIDSGINCDHPDLLGSCVHEFNAITKEVGDGAAKDGNGHGTHVAGTICAAGNNGVGVTGTLWGCELIAIKFLSDSGSGSSFDAIAAIDFAIEKGAKVINASWGGGGYNPMVVSAIERAKAAGILFVAAAGNSNVNTDSSPHYPSAYKLDNIISVGSIDVANRRSTFSNYGKGTVDLAAPGSAILSTYNDGGYMTLSGTSMAAPHVAGVAALVTERFPELAYLQLKDRILSTVRANSELEDITVSGGSLDAFQAIGGIATPTPTPTPAPCEPKGRKKCYEGCRQRFECEYGKQKRCRAECKRLFICKNKRG